MSKSSISRFNIKVEIREGSDCHWWVGGKNKDGYGNFWGDGKNIGAHRFAYERSFGLIPEHDSHHGWCVCHKCDNRACVNPDHLFLGTNKDNVDDKVSKGRQASGPKAGKSKLTEDDVRRIRNLSGTARSIAKQFNVFEGTIGRILKRKTWRHI